MILIFQLEISCLLCICWHKFFNRYSYFWVSYIIVISESIRHLLFKLIEFIPSDQVLSFQVNGSERQSVASSQVQFAGQAVRLLFHFSTETPCWPANNALDIIIHLTNSLMDMNNTIWSVQTFGSWIYNVVQQHETTNSLFLTQKQSTAWTLFFPRAIRLWNELPTEIKDAPTVPAFTSGPNKFYAFNWYFSLVILCFHQKFHM